MSAPGASAAGRSWSDDLVRDTRRLGLPTAVGLAQDAVLADRSTRTRSRKVALGVGALKIGLGVSRLVTLDVGTGLRQISSGGRQILEAAGALKNETAEREARLNMTRTQVEAAAARWPREIDNILIGMRHQRELYFTQNPSKNPSPSPVATGRQLTWQIYKVFRGKGAATEAYREARAHLEQLRASEAAPQALAAHVTRARPTQEVATAHVVRTALLSRPPRGVTPGLPVATRDPRSHLVRGRSADQPRRPGRER
ncbi:hypothetical protein CLV92_102192 [Kineococcus xinjiangensis]|uniref:Uncharacterized protein n=1 Tax=Kineococcus xinjiangensis TaxID=512762 RepID=A0A2S6IV26_9ACTN|nr:hypothetical protein [Kineococcus xinjiangensis]PPK98039.1 hypothetical protein CLV92_102192 [Kineococcus xinjiangensis]